MKHILFVCSQNKLRSPTAEQVFANWPGVEVSSAGTDASCGNPVTPESVEWADVIIAMERTHRNRLQRQFRSSLRNTRIVVLGIPDDYEFMDEQLVRLLKAKVPAFL